MAPMRVPPPKSHDDWRSTQSIEAYAREHGLTVREVRRLLGSGKLPFIELAGQIRVQRTKGEGSMETGSDCMD